MGQFDLTRFELVPSGGGPAVAWATFRGLEPGSSFGTGRAVGLVELEVEDTFRRRGLAVFLLSEAFRRFIRQGIMLVEAQVMHHNAPALGMYAKLGFQQMAQGIVFRKEGSG
jgi:ribosomal protein S18 acetylase RimI-like enzyme